MDNWTHGTYSTYVNHRCRCEDCKAAASEYNRARKVKGLSEGDSRHGTAGGYTGWGCRCDLCVTAIQDSAQKRRESGLPEGDSRHGTSNGYFNFGCRCDQCRSCVKADRGIRNRRLKKAYGISLEQWERLWESQDRRCAVCATEWVEGSREFHVDHDHVTGRVRAILCHGCNVSLGLLGESPERIRALADYIESQQRDYM